MHAERLRCPASASPAWQPSPQGSPILPRSAGARGLQLNLSVRRTAGDKWLMWQSTGDATWLVPDAGLLDLAP